MKKLKIAVLLATVISLMGALTACPEPEAAAPPSIPQAGDFTPVSNKTPQTIGEPGFPSDWRFTAADGSKSQGAITVWYTGTGDNSSYNSTAFPQTAGVYAVSFDVAASGNWAAVNRISAGALVILDPTWPTPTIDDYAPTGLGDKQFNPAGSPYGVTPNPKGGAPAVTIKFYNMNGDFAPDPITVYGSYRVEFEVKNANGWNDNTFFAGVVNFLDPRLSQPGVGDYNITFPSAENSVFNNTARRVTIAAANSSVPDVQTVIYTPSAGSPIQADPSNAAQGAVNADSYTVTFITKAEKNKNSATLPAGTLVVTKRTPTATDYTTQAVYNISVGANENVITIEPASTIPGLPSGTAISRVYTKSDGSTPTWTGGTGSVSATPGNYTVTFNVTAPATSNWASATGLFAGQLVVGGGAAGEETPDINHFKFDPRQFVVRTGTAQPPVWDWADPDGKPSKSAVPPVYADFDGGLWGEVTIEDIKANTVATKRFRVALLVPKHTGAFSEARRVEIGIYTFNTSAEPLLTDFKVNGTGSYTADGTMKPSVEDVPDDEFIVSLSWTPATIQSITFTRPNGTTSNLSARPREPGEYKINFVVAASDFWDAKEFKNVGSITIEKGTPVAAHFEIKNMVSQTGLPEVVVLGEDTKQYAGSPGDILITPKNSGNTFLPYSGGTRTVKFNGSLIQPKGVGRYAITMSVGADSNWNEIPAPGFLMGYLVIESAPPQFLITGLTFGAPGPTQLVFPIAYDEDPESDTFGKQLNIPIVPYDPILYGDPETGEIIPSVTASVGTTSGLQDGTHFNSTAFKNTGVTNTLADTNENAYVTLAGENGAGYSFENLTTRFGKAEFQIGRRMDNPYTFNWTAAIDRFIKDETSEYITYPQDGSVKFEKLATGVGANYELLEWRLNGTVMEANADQSFTFFLNDPGQSTVTLVATKTVEGKTKVYSTTIYITVTAKVK